jgi:hypothetical protein
MLLNTGINPASGEWFHYLFDFMGRDMKDQ